MLWAAPVSQLAAAATNAINAAPPIAPSTPQPVIAPDVPVGTGFQLVMRRGKVRAKTPSSVDQVSALAAASAPAIASHAASRFEAPNTTAAAAATPPLASVCIRSRCEPLENCAASCAFRRPPVRESALDETKKTISSVAPGKPAPPNTAVPTSSAPNAPLGESARWRSPSQPIKAASAAPTK